MSALSSSTTAAHTFNPLVSNAPRARVAFVLAFAGGGAQASAKTNELACLTLTHARWARTTRKASAPESGGSLQLRFSVSKLRATHQLTCGTRNVVAISLRAINHDAITLLIHFDGPNFASRKSASSVWRHDQRPPLEALPPFATIAAAASLREGPA
jgi:hypothetical protein